MRNNEFRAFDIVKCVILTTLENKTTKVAKRPVGMKRYELANHLGNVLNVVTDKKKAVDDNTDGTTDYYVPLVLTANNYYPFGMLMPGQTANSPDYRFGFQGQEKDDEFKGEGNSTNYKYRIHDPRIARFLCVDPLTAKYPYYSPYSFSGNRVIDAIELEGLEPVTHTVKEGDSWESISTQYNVGIGQLQDLNQGVDLSVGSKVNLVDPNRWNYIDVIENMINSGANVYESDLVIHPAGSDKASNSAFDIYDRLIMSENSNIIPGASDFGILQNLFLQLQSEQQSFNPSAGYLPMLEAGFQAKAELEAKIALYTSITELAVCGIVVYGPSISNSIRVSTKKSTNSTGRYLFNNWSKGTFPNRIQSVRYHVERHGKGRTALQYTIDAQSFFKSNKQFGRNWVIKGGSSGIKIQTKQIINGKTNRIGGIWTSDGRIVTFWD